MGAGDILRILRKQVWLIVASFVVIGLGGTAGLVAWYQFAPSYEAQGIINIVPYQGERAGPFGAGPEQIIPIPVYEHHMTSQVFIIKSDTVLNMALKALEGQQTMFRGAQAVQKMAEELDVAYLPRSQNMGVRLQGRDPSEVQRIVRAVLDAYIAFTSAQTTQAEADRQRDLRAERDDLSQQAADLSRRMAAYVRDSNAVVLTDRGGEEMNRLIAMMGQLIAAQARTVDAKSRWDQFQQLIQQATEQQNQVAVMMAFPEVGQELQRNPTVDTLTNQVAALAQQIEALRQRLGTRHEAVKRTEMVYETTRNRLEAERGRLLTELLQQHGTILKASYERLRDTEAALRDEVATARTEAARVAQRAAEYRGMEHEYSRVTALLGTVLDGLERMRIQAALVRPHIRVTQYPLFPVEPSEPKLALYIPLAIVLSLAIGVGLGLLLEFMDTRLRTPAQIVRQVGVPMLGSIPDLAEDERLSLGTDVSLVSYAAPQSLMAEAFRQVRTNLRFTSDEPLKTLLVTSPTPGDGKTVTAVNLAVAMARGGSRTLLVEANFRRPALARTFDVPEAVGLSNVLVGLNPLSEAIQATRIENLDLLVGGPAPPSPADLLGSERMRRLLGEMAGQYDQVIIDAAPILVVADTHLLAGAVSAVILVCQAGENTRGLAQRAARQVLDLRARLIGAVLNRVRATRGGYFRQAYQAYYDYSGAGPEAVVSRPAPAEFRAPAARPQAPAQAAPGLSAAPAEVEAEEPKPIEGEEGLVIEEDLDLGEETQQEPPA
jgi:capsular exopolysaccharide synthesis family protein